MIDLHEAKDVAIRPSKHLNNARNILGFDVGIKFDHDGFIVMPTDIYRKIGWGKDLNAAISHCKERNK
jgi:hypothetical protein